MGQMIQLIVTIVHDPALILLDEPFSSLDVDLREQLAGEVRGLLKRDGITAILVTHDQLEAFAMSDLIGVIHQGRLQQWDTAYRLYHNPANRFVADFIGDINILRGSVLSSQGDKARVRLETGYEGDAGLPTGADGLSNEVSVAIRPEQLSFVDDAIEANLSGSIQHISYFGLGFNYEVLMPSGESVTLRLGRRQGVGPAPLLETEGHELPPQFRPTGPELEPAQQSRHGPQLEQGHGDAVHADPAPVDVPA